MTIKLDTDIDSFDTVEHLVNQNEITVARDMLCRILDEGNDDAYVYLGHLYEVDPEVNSICDFEKAYFYYKKAMDTTGSIDAHMAVA